MAGENKLLKKKKNENRVSGIVLNNNSTLVTGQLDSGMFPEVGSGNFLFFSYSIFM